MADKMRKKSLVGWTYNEWWEELGYFEQATMRNTLKIISLPEIYKNRGKNWIPGSGKPRKVRITIEQLPHKRKG